MLPDYDGASPETWLFTCIECPSGADCTDYGTRWSSLRTLAGFWRPTNSSFNFYRCAFREQCPGGLAASAVFTEVSGSECFGNRIGPKVCIIADKQSQKIPNC